MNYGLWILCENTHVHFIMEKMLWPGMCMNVCVCVYTGTFYYGNDSIINFGSQ